MSELLSLSPSDRSINHFFFPCHASSIFLLPRAAARARALASVLGLRAFFGVIRNSRATKVPSILTSF